MLKQVINECPDSILGLLEYVYDGGEKIYIVKKERKDAISNDIIETLQYISFGRKLYLNKELIDYTKETVNISDIIYANDTEEYFNNHFFFLSI